MKSWFMYVSELTGEETLSSHLRMSKSCILKLYHELCPVCGYENLKINWRSTALNGTTRKNTPALLLNNSISILCTSTSRLD